MCACIGAAVPVYEPVGVSDREGGVRGVKSRHWYETLRVLLQHKTSGKSAQSLRG